MVALTPTVKRYIFKIIPFGIIWLVFSVIYLLIEKGILGDTTIYPSTGNLYDFGGNFLITSVTTTLTGLLVGFIEVVFLSKLFTKDSFRKKLFYKSLFYAFIMIAVLMIIAIITTTIQLEATVFDKQVWDIVFTFLTSFAFWSVEIYMASIIVVSLFYSEVSDNLGQGVLVNFFKGKYHNPIEEERIFMFLDMKSSTTIAEKLGHIQYFEMLKRYYADLSDGIVQYAGEIYQYVGDEIVISWDVKSGLYNNNYVNCFFAMKESIEKKSSKYRSFFGLVPSFKAGVHFGKVTAGEIGIIKKDIVFTGDVLNTTARIQALCNEYDVDLLISEQLLTKTNLNSDFESTSLGMSKLRGRLESVNVYTLKKSE